MTANGAHVGIGMVDLDGDAEIAAITNTRNNAVEKVVHRLVQSGAQIDAAVKVSLAGYWVDAKSGLGAYMAQSNRRVYNVVAHWRHQHLRDIIALKVIRSRRQREAKEGKRTKKKPASGSLHHAICPGASTFSILTTNRAGQD